MQKIHFISTGGTFNKYYEPNTGSIAIDTHASTLEEIAQKWRCRFEISNIIGKDSLDMNDEDRSLLLETIVSCEQKRIVIIHGTDTMDLSAKVIADANLDKQIILVGAMTPYRVDKVEATANLAMAIGYLNSKILNGVYISMNGIIGNYDKVIKNRKKGKFEWK